MAFPFSSSVQAWAPYLAPLDDGQHGGMNFLQAWLQKESNGNPCSFPYKTGESGIWQLMPSTVRGNTGNDLDHAGTTAAEQHPIPPCAANTETSGVTVADLTPDQIDAQIRAGRTYLDYAISTVRASLAAGSSTIDDTMPDFWQFVKLIQGAPAWVKSGPSQYLQETGAGLTSWDDFESWAKGKGCWGSNNCSGTLANARAVGAYGSNDSSNPPSPSLVDQIIVLSGPDTGIQWWAVGLAALGGIAAGVAAWRKFGRKRAA